MVKKKKISAGDRTFHIAVLVIVLLMCVITLYPIYYMLIVSISDGNAVLRGDITILPKGINFGAYKAVLSNEYVPKAYLNTLIYTLAGTLVSVGMTALCAYPLSRKEFYGRGIFTGIVVFTMFFDAGIISNYMVVQSAGLMNSIWAIILPGAINVWYMIIMRTFFSDIPEELFESARLDGAVKVTGLSHTFPGQGLGVTENSNMPVLEPVLNYQIILPEGCDVHQMLKKLKELEEEDPQLHIVWDEQLGEIHAMLMGDVQIEILKRLIWERFHVTVDFGTGNIVYKETIAAPVEGVGHFEPLRHYAEVHLLLEPGEQGSGMQFFTACSEDVLDRNWQRLILTHLEEKEHRGVLTGAPITDMQITLLGGIRPTRNTRKAEISVATYRAIRRDLRKHRMFCWSLTMNFGWKCRWRLLAVQ